MNTSHSTTFIKAIITELPARSAQAVEIAAHKELQEFLSDNPKAITETLFMDVARSVTQATPITISEAVRSIETAGKAWQQKLSASTP